NRSSFWHLCRWEGVSDPGEERRRDARAAEQELPGWGGGQFAGQLDVAVGAGAEVLACGAAQVLAVGGGVEAGAGNKAVDNPTSPGWADLYLAEAGAVGNDVGGEEDAGDEPPVGADEEVGDPAVDLLQARQRPAAGAVPGRPGTDVADPVTNQWHG